MLKIFIMKEMKNYLYIIKTVTLMVVHVTACRADISSFERLFIHTYKHTYIYVNIYIYVSGILSSNFDVQ